LQHISVSSVTFLASVTLLVRSTCPFTQRLWWRSKEW
jgi:hypothetical protein